MTLLIDEQKRLLIADDDPVFARSLQRAMERRGFTVVTAGSVDRAHELLDEQVFSHATLDLRIGDESGLDLLEMVSKSYPDMRCVILTAYGNIATAVTATKFGALEYLAKPVDADLIEAALTGGPRVLATRQSFVRPEEQEFRYLHAMYEQHGRNMSETARATGMHRRTLQRILRRHGIGPAPHPSEEARNDQPNVRRLYRLWTRLLEPAAS